MKTIMRLLTVGIMMAVASQLLPAQKNLSAGTAPSHNEINVGVNDDTVERLKKEVVIELADTSVCLEDEVVFSFSTVQHPPMFPGGEAAMYEWMAANINYPATAIEEGVQGRVVVKLIVGRDGAIRNVKVMRGKHPALDKEALRLVRSMPKWTPGYNEGKPVSVSYLLPVTFKLQEKKK